MKDPNEPDVNKDELLIKASQEWDDWKAVCIACGRVRMGKLVDLRKPCVCFEPGA